MRPQRGSRAMSTIGEKTQCDAVGAGFLRAGARDGLGCLGIPAGRHGQRHGKRGAVAVDHIQPEEDGDVQPRFLHRDVLIVVCLLGAHHVEHRTDLALGNQIVVGQIRGRWTGGKSGRILHRLPDLFLERHLFQQRFDAGVDFL